MAVVKVFKKSGDIMTLVKITKRDKSIIEIYVPSFQYEEWRKLINLGKININTELDKTINTQFEI